MPMTVGGFPQTTRSSSSSSIAHHHRRVLRSDDDSLPKFAVVIPIVAIRDGDETHLVLLLVCMERERERERVEEHFVKESAY